jgi:TolB-like protein/DNA-binding winged helix-turn-helix (wHTH) protein
MSAPASSTDRVQFGVFELDLQRAELRKQGIKVKLQEQPLKLLQVLLETPGQIVTREKLRTRIWPANTFVEFDQGLYSAMARLRDALGDSSDSPRFVETVARRGYRFIAPITGTLVSPDRGSSPQPKVITETTRPALYRRWIASLIAGLVGGALLLGIVFSFDILGAREWLRSRTTPIRSIAVLPLENLSADPDQDYFADGMTDELITNLARLGTLRVVSRTSVMRYKKTSKTLPQIGQELNVDGIVEGTVERSGNRVRIRVQLIQASSDRHLWAQTYDRELRDTLALQTEAAGDIVNEIQPSLTSAKQQGPVVPRRVNPDAYEAYLKGLYFSNKRSPESFKRALEYSRSDRERS